MKSISILSLLIAFAFLFAACGDSENGEPEGDEVEVKYVIGFSQCNSAEPWREAMNKKMQEEAEKHPEIELMISDAQQDNSKQVADIENFIVSEVDLLIVSPNEAKPLTGVVEKAFEKGIPVIVIDRKIESEKYTTFIGADNEVIGKAAGEYAAKLLNGKGKIVEIWGLKGSTPAIERHNGFMQGIVDFPDIEIIYEQDGEWLRRRGQEIMENALQSLEEIDLVYAHNDPMAMGAFLAAKNLNRADNIFFLGIDGLPGAEGGAQAVLNGELDATFLYPTGGGKAILTALDILNGKEVPKKIDLETVTISPDNAEQYK